ncbi:MAG: tail fiber domain-containing protein, partial [Candidatus Paceibacterota bacterium]
IQDANTLLVLGAGGLSSTVSATDTLTITLDDTTVTGGSYGSASEVATFTVNTKGQLTAAGTTSIAIDTSQITSGTLGLNRGGTGSSSFTNGSVIFSDGSKLTQDNDNFFWDDSNNRLGIGTTSPAGILDITKDSGFAYLQPTAVTTDGGLKDSPVIRLRGKYDSDGTTGITSANYNFDIKQTMTAGGTSPISRLGFLNNAGTEVLSLLSSGNVGIGTTSPGSKFSVLAGSATSGLSVQDSRSGVTAGDLLVGNNTGAGGYVTIGRLSSNSNDNTVFRIRNRVGSPVLYMNAGNGNLGIGTSSPGYKLDVQSYSFMVGANNSDGVDRTDNTNKTARMFLPHYTNAEEPVTMFMAGSTATDNYINYGGGTSLGNSATSLRFLTAANGTTATGTERMRIDSVGNVGIGTTSPGAKLEIETGAAATKGLIIQGAASQSANLTEWQNSAGTVKALVNSSGDFSNTGGQTNGEIFGAGATVTAAGGTALGYSATAGNLAVAIGDATASGIRSIAVSNQANASGNDSIAMGLRSAVSADYGIAIGRDSTAAMDGLALGRQSTAGLDGIALGRDSTASAQAIAIGAGVSSSLVSIGQNLTATGTQNVLLGIGSSSSSNRGIAIGNNAVAGGVGDSLSIGLRATSGNRSIALGRDSTAGANAIAFGESATAADNELAIKWASGVGVIQGDANGNVGIGTGSPGAKLVVKGSGTSSDTLVQFTDSGDTPKFTIWDNGTTTIGGHVASDGGAGVLNVAKSVTDGNVALVIANSTQSTAGSLESASLEFKLRRGGGDGLDVAGGKIVASRLGAYGSTADRDSSLDFYTVNNDSQTMKMRIDNVGNVGIGTTSPSQALDLVGALKLENTTSSTTGVIYKGGSRFIHNFQHPTGDTAVPDGFNTFVGIDAGNFTMGSTATSIGQASYNTGVGYQVLNSNTTGNYNVASGYQVLNSNTTGAANVASGYQSLYANTTGNFNVASGFQSLYANTTGGGNIAIGSDTLKANTTGNFNIATGYGSLLSNTTGSSNIANGFYSMFNNTTGSENIAIGVQSLNNNTTGRYNIAIGGFAGGNINPAGGTDGANSLFGYSTGLGITTGINNTILGANVTGLAPGLSNNVILADGAGNQRIRIDSSGQVGIGTTSPSTTLHVAGDAKIETISAGTGSAVCFDAGNVLVDCSASSIAYKTDVNSMTTATDEVMQMRPVTFKWKENGQEDFGFIAQEMAEVNPLYATFKDGEVHGVHYSKLTSVIVKAMQEQNQRITTLEEKVAGMSDTQITIDSTDNILSNDLTFSGAMTVDNNLTVTKDMTVKGIMTLYSDLVVDTVHVAKALNVHGDVNIFGKLVVDGDVEVKGRLSISEQQAGMAAIPPGEVEVEVTYKQAYEEAPLIQVTPQAATNGYWISKQTAEGFSISLTETTSQGVTFNWVTLPVLASEEEELDEVVENNETPVAEETAPEEVVVEEEKISIKNTGWFNGDNVESLRVREDATVASTEITTVASGDTFVYTETKDGWYLIEIEEGVSGWVSAEYVEEVEAG